MQLGSEISLMFFIDILGHYDKAMECYNNAIKLDLNYSLAYNHKGQVLYTLESFEEAKIAFLKAIAIESDYADSFYNLALVCDALKEHNASNDYLKQAIFFDDQYKIIAEECILAKYLIN